MTKSLAEKEKTIIDQGKHIDYTKENRLRERAKNIQSNKVTIHQGTKQKRSKRMERTENNTT